MKTKLFAFLMMFTLILAGLPVASAAQPLPTIVTFESDLESITVSDAETGETAATLSWHTVGMTGDYRLTLHSYQVNAWTPVFPDVSVPLEPNASRLVTIKHPLNFGPPTYLLSIVDAQSRIVDQRTLMIPYTESTETSTIRAFSTEVESVDANALAQNTVQLTVVWEITDRLPMANPVFEQVFEDESAVSVELPRPNLWIPSAGHGPVAPVFREGEESVQLRMQIVDVVTDEVYDEEILTLEITGAITEPAPTVAPPQPTPAPDSSADIVSFTAVPNVVNPGAAITLSWEVRGTGGIAIDQTLPNQVEVETIVTAQSPKGSTTVYLSEYAAYSVTYTLRLLDRNGSATTSVQVNCPYTFFFGQGDGCPTGPAHEVEAAYQPFEGGIMVWRGDTLEIYALYDDGTAAYFLEQSYAEMGEPNVDDNPPPLDRSAPIRGFGKVWANAPGVREKLGWALESESAYTMQIQQVATTRQPPPDFSIYLTLPDGTVAGTGYGKWLELEIG